MKWKNIFFTLASILLSSAMFVAQPTLKDVASSSGARVSVIPPYFSFGAFPDVLVVNITITDVIDLYAYQVKIIYNASILEIADFVWPSDYVFSYADEIFKGSKILEPGSVVIGTSLIGVENPTFNGSGILCQLLFNITHFGTSTLEFGEGAQFPTRILNFDEEEMPFESFDGVVDVKPLIPPSYVVAIEPLHNVVSWHGRQNLVDFNMSLDGVNYCNMTIPLDAMDGPFEIVIDNDWTNKIGYSTDFNVTHVFLHVTYDYNEGVHNVKLIDSAWGDLNRDGRVNILDIAAVAQHFGETL